MCRSKRKCFDWLQLCFCIAHSAAGWSQTSEALSSSLLYAVFPFAPFSFGADCLAESSEFTLSARVHVRRPLHSWILGRQYWANSSELHGFWVILQKLLSEAWALQREVVFPRSQAARRLSLGVLCCTVILVAVLYGVNKDCHWLLVQ
jgi:preprotein translocase subunit SecE